MSGAAATGHGRAASQSFCGGGAFGTDRGMEAAFQPGSTGPVWGSAGHSYSRDHVKVRIDGHGHSSLACSGSEVTAFGALGTSGASSGGVDAMELDNDIDADDDDN